jgi:hypothetical protein
VAEAAAVVAVVVVAVVVVAAAVVAVVVVAVVVVAVVVPQARIPPRLARHPAATLACCCRLTSDSGTDTDTGATTAEWECAPTRLG